MEEGLEVVMVGRVELEGEADSLGSLSNLSAFQDSTLLCRSMDNNIRTRPSHPLRLRLTS